MPLPRNRILRITIGVLLLVGGVLGFLPILGFWMVPLGLLVLSIDFAIARRVRRRSEVTLLRWWRNRGFARRGEAPPPPDADRPGGADGPRP